MEETVQAMKVHLLSSNHDGAQENKWDVPFDPSLREVTVSLSGPTPQIELSDPFGRDIINTFYMTFLCQKATDLNGLVLLFKVVSSVKRKASQSC